MRLFVFDAHIRLLAALGAIALIIGFALRLILFAVYSADFGWSFLPLLQALFFGAINDLFSLAYILIPAAVLALPFGDRLFFTRIGKIYLYALLFFCAFAIVFAAAGEYFFWGATHSRFNFIALDYTINGSRLFENAFNAVSIAVILVIAAIVSALFVFGASRLFAGSAGSLFAGRTRLALFWIHAAIAAMIFFAYSPFAVSESRAFDQLGRNGIYELFSAKRSKAIDRRAFYPSLPKEEAFAIVINEIKGKGDRFLSDNAKDFIKITAPKTKQISPNVIVVIASGMDKKLLPYAPNINGYTQDGLSFERLYATGAGAARTIEAFSLSLPPIAGDSIIRRIDKPLPSVSTVFNSRGYASEFIYGGYGYYGNLNNFFSLNGYEIIDRLAFAKENKTFVSRGRQSDEDLFAEAIARADRNYVADRRFFQVLLASSINAPYNYPRARIDIAPKTSREGAARYFDYALGRFIDAARAKPWFENTIFVVLSDRSLGSKSDDPRLAEYETIGFFYAPKLIAPRKVDTLCSQIDIAPTLFGLLGWGYESRFFGRDILDAPPSRALVATNTHLAFAASNGDFVILRPS
ncbi:MAG: sulfatase-like hydrolase/transferase, partial [Helicobacteraceae bacterium]|nr:sulfatase-like hydrolase/transferase [Helicobacteraceae bacterium]